MSIEEGDEDEHDRFKFKERKYMKPVIRYQSQLLYRKAYKPNWRFKPRPAQRPFVFRPARAAAAPKAAWSG